MFCFYFSVIVLEDALQISLRLKWLSERHENWIIRMPIRLRPNHNSHSVTLKEGKTGRFVHRLFLTVSIGCFPIARRHDCRYRNHSSENVVDTLDYYSGFL